MRIDIWSDIACPWCYLAHARFGKALDAYAHRGEVQVVHRSFELNPALRKGDTQPIVKALMEKAGMSYEQAQANEVNLGRQTAREGLGYVMDRDHGSTFDMHRLLQFAKRQGRQQELLEAMYRGNFADDRSIYNDERLRALAVEAGLDAEQADAVLADPSAFADAVRADEAEASKVGAYSVPFFLFTGHGTFTLVGAQPTAIFAQALERAHG